MRAALQGRNGAFAFAGYSHRMERSQRAQQDKATQELVERATDEDTDVLTMLETEDALNAIPDKEVARSESDAARSNKP